MSAATTHTSNGRTDGVNEELKRYIEAEILPRYEAFDQAHQRGHADDVIRNSLYLAQFYPTDLNMVYVIAAFHDTGLTGGRKTHHLLSGEIVRSDEVLPRFFTASQIETMAQAVEDHRASSEQAPRSVYGKIVAEADRNISTETIVTRALQYGLDHYPIYNKEEHYQRFLQHMHEKYDYGGYLKLWIPESPNAARLEEFRQILRDETRTKTLFEVIWKCLQEHP